MKKIIKCIIIVFIFSFFYMFSSININARELIGNNSLENIFGETLGKIQLYDDGKLEINYKYGLRRVDVYYCESGFECDNNLYSMINALDSNSENTYKNNGERLATYTYKIALEEDKDYGIRVAAYFGTGTGYKGTENLNGSPTISSVHILNSERMLEGKKIKKDTVDHKGINKLISKMKKIVNTIILPVLYTIVGFVLVIKGAILGVEIVKSADKPDVRSEKVSSLKWLIIGTIIAFVAASVVGVLTGFFDSVF